MQKYKYTILTFIIGKGYEKVHEIINKQDDVEYLLITDDNTLQSNTWQVIYDKDLLQYKSPFEKCFKVRYNVFKYCTSDICVTIDGSMQVKGSLDKLIDKFNQGQYDICLMPHPFWNDFYTEYNAWMRMRNYPLIQAQRAINYFQDHNYDFSYKGLFQLCFSIKRRSDLTNDIDKQTYKCLEDLSYNSQLSKEFERLDQTVFTYVVNKFFNNIKVLPVSEQVVRSYAIQWYWHNSENPNNNIGYDIDKEDKKFVFNKEVICEYLI